MKCELCGSEHEKWQAHVFKNKHPEAVVPLTSRPTTTSFDRRAYQRAYMRTYRRRQSLMVQTARALLDHIAEPWPRG